ncbi:MAG: hypothetical protein WEE89_01445 [Gemmatimonadota bacterium]
MPRSALSVDELPSPPVTELLPRAMSCSGCGTGRERSWTALISVKMPALAPMPSARVVTSTAANPALRSNPRTA